MLFYAKRLGIFSYLQFLSICFLREIFFVHTPIEYELFSHRSIWPITVGTTTLDQSGFGSNDNDGVLYIHQISRIGALPSDAVKCHTQNTHCFFFGGEVLTPLQGIQSVYSKPCKQDKKKQRWRLWNVLTMIIIVIWLMLKDLLTNEWK